MGPRKKRKVDPLLYYYRKGEEYEPTTFLTKVSAVLVTMALLLIIAAVSAHFWLNSKQQQIHTADLNSGAPVIDVPVSGSPETGQPWSLPSQTSSSSSEASSSPSSSEAGSSTASTPSTTSTTSAPSSTTTATPPPQQVYTPKQLEAGAENVLVMGTDTRQNTKSGIGGNVEGYGHSDVMMVVHIPADRQSITVVSIPRDTMVAIPRCKLDDGGYSDAQNPGQVNSALTHGPGCAVATVEAMSGLKITHFAVISFDAAIALSNAVGGVQVTVDQPIHDDYSGLNLSAGTRVLQGKEALAYVRSRHGVGDGSDLGRIKDQHEFLQSLASKMLSSGTLTNPVKLNSIADAITKNLTVDPGLNSLEKLQDLGNSLSTVPANKVKFVTLPVEYWSENKNRVIPIDDAASALWTSLGGGAH